MLATLALVFPAMPGLAASPAMFRGDPAHLGVYASTDAPTLATAKWKFSTGGKVLSSPAVDSGSVYFGSSDRYLYAVSAEDGTLRWKFATKGPVNRRQLSPMPVRSAASTLLLRSTRRPESASGPSRRGEQRFTAPTSRRDSAHGDDGRSVRRLPVVAGGRRRDRLFRSGDHNVYALDARPVPKWKHTTGNVIHASPATRRRGLHR
jgi:outer membrane protein assembly factor BamB